jgi:three-Cys-motif partner protein
LNDKPNSSASHFNDDGFSITAAEPWFKVKVQLVQHYLHSFVTNAASRADEIVFIDLFSGSGLYSVGHKKELFAASSLASLQTELPISKWIFCENDPEQAKALKVRVNKFFRSSNVLIVEEDQDQPALLAKLQGCVPRSKGSYKVATLCLVDPFSLEVPFASLLSLSATLGCSFLIPFSFIINDRHNYEFYLGEQYPKLKRYVGSDISRAESIQSNFHFYKRVVNNFRNNMLVNGHTSSLSVHKLNSALMDLPMFYMGYFSKQVSPKLIQADVQATQQVQFELF